MDQKNSENTQTFHVVLAGDGLILLAYDHKCDALRGSVAFVQFKKRKKHPWRSVTFSKVAS